MNMTTTTSPKVTHIEQATTARWLAAALEHARADVTEVPTAEAVDRMRARVLGEQPARKLPHPIAA
jgi:hypothetical protein